MKKIAMTAIAAALAFSAPVFADDAHHPEKAAEAKGAPAQIAPQVKKMQDNLKKMQPQLDRIVKAKTDAERQKAMAEHMQTMQENMGMARGMQARSPAVWWRWCSNPIPSSPTAISKKC